MKSIPPLDRFKPDSLEAVDKLSNFRIVGSFKCLKCSNELVSYRKLRREIVDEMSRWALLNRLATATMPYGNLHLLVVVPLDHIVLT